MCKVGQLLADTGPLTSEDRATLAGLVTCPYPEAVSATTLARALRAIGHRVGPTTVKDHRGDRCACTTERTT